MALLEDPAAGVTDNDRSLELARNPALTPEAQELLLTRDSRVLDVLAANPSLDADVLDVLALSDDPQVLAALARNPRTPARLQATFLRNPSPVVRVSLAANPALGGGVLADFVASLPRHHGQRCPCHSLSFRKDLTHDQARALLKHDLEACVGVLALPGLPEDLRRACAERALLDESLVPQVARDAGFSEDDLRELARRDPRTFHLFAEAPNLPADVLASLLSHALEEGGRRDLLQVLLRTHEFSDDVLLSVLADPGDEQDGFSSVRLAVACNPRISRTVAARVMDFHAERQAFLWSGLPFPDLVRAAIDPSDVNCTQFLHSSPTWHVSDEDLVSYCLEARPRELFALLGDLDPEVLDALVESWAGTVGELRDAAQTFAPAPARTP
jgi:hypothetical protein